MTREKVIDKIKKLLALSRSDNEHEAALAASKAQELLDKENVRISEVEGVSESEISEYLVKEKGRFMSWEVQLFAKLAKTMDCFPYIATNRAVKMRRLMVAGYKQDVEVFNYLREYVGTSILKLVDRALKEQKKNPGWSRRRTIAFKNAFGAGASTRVCEIIDAQRKERLSRDVTCRDLVIARGLAVQEWAVKNLDLTKGTSRRVSYNVTGWDMGYEAGNDISIRNAVNGETPSGQIESGNYER